MNYIIVYFLYIHLIHKITKGGITEFFIFTIQ